MARRSRQTRTTIVPRPEGLPTWNGAVSVVLRSGTVTPPLAGHPWVYSGAIAHTVAGPDTAIEAGMPCGLFDPHGRFLGAGYYNPASQIAVRLMVRSRDGQSPQMLPDLGRLARLRVGEAAELRESLGLPNADTNAYRLVNSEGDLLPGVTVDCYAGGAVVQLSTAGAWRMRAGVLDGLEALGRDWVLLQVPHDAHPAEGLPGGSAEDHGPVPSEVQVRHNGLKLRVGPGRGQKTGMYCDQRENHARVAALAKGAFVVDAFCHGGGFGLHAARAGAGRVLCVDASQKAIDITRQHAQDNGLDVETERADAVHLLRRMGAAPEQERPQVVIVDPPNYAPKAAAVAQALRKYRALNTVALEAVQPGGLLVSCSCAGLVAPETFLRTLGAAAGQAGVAIQLLELLGAGPDHPVAPAHAEGRYLKVAICRVGQRSSARLMGPT